MKENPNTIIAGLGRALAHDFRLMPLYTPDCPVFLSVAWPVAEGVTGQKPRLPAGRGMTPQQALIAAGAEALELRASLAQRRTAELAALPRTGGIAMVTARDLLTGEMVPVPAQEVYLDSASVLVEPLINDANSTGCAVGPTRNDATASALWECVERDAIALWWHGSLRAGPQPLDIIDRLQPRLFWWLHQRVRSSRLLDLTTDIGLPVIAAFSADPDGRFVAMGYAARPHVADAALSAVTEMVQTEFSMEEARAADDPELAIWVVHGSTKVQPQFRPATEKVHLPVPPEPDDIVRRLADLGHRVLTIDMTLPGDPLPSMRVLVPGLCAMRGRVQTDRFRRLCPDTTTLCFPEPF